MPARGDEDENDELAKEPAVGAAVVLLMVVFALDVYRAATQSITHDEALTVLSYAFGPVERIFTEFTANNHVLHTLLVRASVRAFGISEWAVRLPALLGGLIYLGASLAVCRRAFGGGWTFLVAYGLLALNPLLLDFQSIARGYGLGLGLCMYALAHLLGALQGHESGHGEAGPHGRMLRASIGLGLAVSANLTLAPLAGGLLALTAVAIIAQQRRLPGGARTRGSVLVGLTLLLVPFAVVAGLLLTAPLQDYEPGQFFVGLGSLSAAGANLVDHAIGHVPDAWPLRPDSEAYEIVRGVLLVLAGPVLLLAALLRIVLVVRSWRGKTSLAELSGLDRFHYLAGGSLVLGVLALVVAHHAVGVAYPIDRTGLWIVALAHLVAVGLVADAWRGGPLSKVLAAVLLAGLWVLLVQYGSQIQAREYAVWRHDAGTATVFDEIRRANDRAPRETVVVECSWYYEPSLNFYRLSRRAQWMPEVQRGYDPDDLQGDWLVVHPDLEERPLESLVEIRYQDPVSRTVLGVPRRPEAAPEQADAPAGDGAQDGPPPGSASPPEDG